MHPERVYLVVGTQCCGVSPCGSSGTIIRSCRARGESNSSQQELDTTLSVVNTTLLSWCLIQEGHRDVDGGQDTLLLGIVLLVVYLMESSKMVQEQSETRGGSRLPDCPLNYVSSFIFNILDVSATITRHKLSYSQYASARLIILIQSSETIPLVTRQVRSYWNVSHRFLATGTRCHRTTICTRYHGLNTVLLLLYTTTATTEIDEVQAEEACNARNTTWYSLLLLLTILLLSTTAGA